ncbi:cation:proton antiporter [Actinomadura madurae]|uniref:cation:proton antiporter n=1 Tax=Actinomadura madurae TaxID=1993 RepID=UPI00399AEC6E
MLRVDVLLLDLVIVLALARLLGAGARLIGQPPVIGEILAGILLGPTVLGHLIGDGLFPADVRPALEALADVGLVLFMLVVGMELDQKLVRGQGRAAASVALGSMTLPLGLGCLLALGLADDHARGETLSFVLFFGTAISATAFPVLARIITDRGMQRTRLGALALASAAIADVMVWTALTIIIGASGSSAWQSVMVVPFGIFMFVVVRPQLRRLIPVYERAGRLTPGILTLVLLGLFCSALATESMHIHFIFGAFLFGAVMPREGAERLNQEILARLEQITVLMLLPMFFVVSGLAVDLSALEVSSAGTLAAILTVAVLGKLGGAYAGARLRRVPQRQSAALATLMNTHGLTEIVILSVGLEKGILDKELYSLMVVVALLTTAMTGPLLRRVYPDRAVARDRAEAEGAALGEHTAYRVLAVVEDPANGAALAKLARDVALSAARVPASGRSEVILAHIRDYPTERLESSFGLQGELADIIAALSEMESLAAEIRGDDLPVRVVSRFSGDMAAELPLLAAKAEADVVVVSPTQPGYSIFKEKMPALLITTMRPDIATSVAGEIAVLYERGGEVAVEMALRLAAGRALTVVGGRRASALADRLARLGIGVHTSAARPDGTPLVAMDGPDTADAHLLVHPGPRTEPIEWSSLVTASAGSESGGR